MGNRTRSLLWVGVTALLLVAALGQIGATGLTSGRVNLAAVTFVQRQSNDSPPFFCEATDPGAWEAGLLRSGAGLFVAPVVLPSGATVTKLTYAVRDDSAGDSSVRLVRKDAADGANGFSGRYVMAAVSSSDAAEQVRRFEDTTIGGATVNTARYTYIAVITNCDSTISPIAVIVDYTVP